MTMCQHDGKPVESNPATDEHGAESRDCYCNLWETDPAVFEKGLPRGYCGFCEVCGKPGHTRHYPGPRPYTGSWCDEHYAGLSRLPTLFNCVLFALVVGGGLYLVYRVVAQGIQLAQR